MRIFVVFQIYDVMSLKKGNFPIGQREPGPDVCRAKEDTRKEEKEGGRPLKHQELHTRNDAPTNCCTISVQSSLRMISNLNH